MNTQIGWVCADFACSNWNRLARWLPTQSKPKWTCQEYCSLFWLISLIRWIPFPLILPYSSSSWSCRAFSLIWFWNLGCFFRLVALIKQHWRILTVAVNQARRNCLMVPTTLQTLPELCRFLGKSSPKKLALIVCFQGKVFWNCLFLHSLGYISCANHSDCVYLYSSLYLL